MKARVAVLRVTPDTILSDIDRLVDLAGVSDASAREHATLGQGHPLDALLDLQRLQAGKVRRRPGRDHTVGLLRGGEIDATDGGMREITPRERDVEAAGGMQIVDVTSDAANQVGVFDAANRRTENGRGHSDEV